MKRAPKVGEVVTWWTTSGGWRYGRFNRIVTKGRRKGHYEVVLYGKLLPPVTKIVPPDKIRKVVKRRGTKRVAA